MRAARTLVLLLLVLLVPIVSAHEVDQAGVPQVVSMRITPQPDPLEPGPVTLHLTIAENNLPLTYEPVLIQLTRGKHIILNTTTITNEQGEATIELYVERAGYYTLTTNTHGAQATTELQVHGRAVLVIGFLIALAILFAILLDRL